MYVYVYIIKIYIELHLCGYICICKYMHIYLTRVRGERMLVYPNWYVDYFPGLLVIGIRSSSYKMVFKKGTKPAELPCIILHDEFH